MSDGAYDPVMIRPEPAKIVVPRKHGQVLIEPALGTLAEAVRSAAGGGVGANPEQRIVILKAAGEWAERTDVSGPPADAASRPLVVTGHQSEFYHAGVWAKMIAADEVARRVNGVAIDLIVDHDTIKERGFEVPEQIDSAWRRVPVDFAESSALPVEALTAPTRAAFDEWDARLAKFPLTHVDSLAFFLTELKPANEAMPHAAWLSRARRRFEASMGIDVFHVPTSLLCRGELWQQFVNAWADNAEHWTEVYNRHLAEYRRREEIKNAQHPMPDLTRDLRTGVYELPFWIYRIGDARERLMIRRQAGKQVWLCGGREIADAQSQIPDEKWLIRPRALTLTMFVRRCFADVFIHGIGGALYDQVTDGIMQELFAHAGPYGCVSAAWLLPLGQPLENLDDLAALRWRRHHVAHNPQFAIDPFTALKTDVAELIVARKNIVQQIAASLQSSRRDAAAKSQRHAWFDQLHQINHALHAKAPRMLANLDHELFDAARAFDQNKVLLWREYFFGLHTTASLQSLISKIRLS